MAEGDRERWDVRHRQGEAPQPRGAFLEALVAQLPAGGRALDVACGRGSLSLWLAARGHEVTAVDVSPVALAALSQAAGQRGLSVTTLALDLELEPLPAGPFELIACLHYRQPALVPQLAERLSPGGVLALEQHTVDNLERHARPSRRFLAEPGELAGWARQAGLSVEHALEGWVEGRAVAQVLARRRG